MGEKVLKVQSLLEENLAADELLGQRSINFRILKHKTCEPVQ